MIDVETLTSFETAEDGGSVRMHMRDAAGAPVIVSMPVACLNRLLMTLPRMLAGAVRRQHRDASLRIVYPADSMTLELGSDLSTRIMTLVTPDGFEVSFGLSGAQCREIGASSAKVAELRAQRAARVN